jgi:hypothetical protein
LLRVAGRFVDGVDVVDDVDNMAVSPGMKKGSGTAPFVVFHNLKRTGMKPVPTM